MSCVSRIFAHADDPDINDPFEVPKGNVLGSSDQSEGATNQGMANLEIYIQH